MQLDNRKRIPTVDLATAEFSAWEPSPVGRARWFPVLATAICISFCFLGVPYGVPAACAAVGLTVGFVTFEHHARMLRIRRIANDSELPNEIPASLNIVAAGVCLALDSGVLFRQNDWLGFTGAKTAFAVRRTDVQADASPSLPGTIPEIRLRYRIAGVTFRIAVWPHPSGAPEPIELQTAFGEQVSLWMHYPSVSLGKSRYPSPVPSPGCHDKLLWLWPIVALGPILSELIKSGFGLDLTLMRWLIDSAFLLPGLYLLYAHCALEVLSRHFFNRPAALTASRAEIEVPRVEAVR